MARSILETQIYAQGLTHMVFTQGVCHKTVHNQTKYKSVQDLDLCEI